MNAKLPVKRPISQTGVGAEKSASKTPHPPHRQRINGFSEILRNLTSDRQLAMDAIRMGFPTSMLKDAGLYFDVPPHRIQAIARLSDHPAQAVAKPGANLDPAVSERIWRLADLMATARKVFDDEESAKNWLRTPNRTFGSVAPMDYLDTEPGAMAVRQVLNAIATGGVV